MDRKLEQSIYELLASMGEAIEIQKISGQQEEIGHLISDGRRQVTAAIDGALPDTLESRIDSGKLSDDDFLRTAYWVVGEISEPFQPKNLYDREFQTFLTHIWTHTSQELLENMIKRVEKLRECSEQAYRSFVEYFSRFPLWGTFDPARGDYDTLRRRAEVLKQHSYDFLWLYQRLEDYLSRRTLCAILKNWAWLDLDELVKVKSIFPDYWEPDIFPDNENEVLVDVGAFTGDSIAQYIRMYGDRYKRIYAYEISEDSRTKLNQNIGRYGWHDIVVKGKGAGRAQGEMFLTRNGSDPSANQISKSGGTGTLVKIVPLDTDITEPINFLKMDIEGAEQNALLGCEQTIRRDHPKLAICTYHGYEDIWKIPLMIDCMYPEYQFYLRHYGGNLIPTEFVLLCSSPRSATP